MVSKSSNKSGQVNDLLIKKSRFVFILFLSHFSFVNPVSITSNFLTLYVSGSKKGTSYITWRLLEFLHLEELRALAKFFTVFGFNVVFLMNSVRLNCITPNN